MCPPDFTDAGLVTVIPTPDKSGNIVKDVEEYVHRASEHDDVFCAAFLSSVIVTGDSCEGKLEIEDLPQAWRTTKIACLSTRGSTTIPLPGSYVLKDQRLRQVFRLYDDDVNAFSIAFRHSEANRYYFTTRTKPCADDIPRLSPLRVGGSRHNACCVAVPSRLRFQPSPSKPLHGTRITVKDIFDIEGLRTSLGSREYLKLYPPVSTTAPSIQKLIDLGCHVVGLSQMCSTVLKQDPTQSIEFLAPFNPRADGWQSPSGGSHGQACAVARYDWLDIAIASDCEYVNLLAYLV